MNVSIAKTETAALWAAVCCCSRLSICCSISRSINGAVALTTGAATEEDSTKSREYDELHCLSFRAFIIN